MIIKIQKSLFSKKKRYFINGVLASESKFMQARYNKYAKLIEDTQLHTIYEV